MSDLDTAVDLIEGIRRALAQKTGARAAAEALAYSADAARLVQEMYDRRRHAQPPFMWSEGVRAHG